MILTPDDGSRREIDLVRPDATDEFADTDEIALDDATDFDADSEPWEPGMEEPPQPGVSPLDRGMEQIREMMSDGYGEEAGDECDVER